MLNINRDDLIIGLQAIRHCLHHDKIDDTDVRLVLYSHDEHGTDWGLATGDVSYDLVHGIACGASMIGQYDTNDAIRETADDLISQVEDQFAEVSS